MLAGLVYRHVVQQSAELDREIRSYEAAATKYQGALLCQCLCGAICQGRTTMMHIIMLGDVLHGLWGDLYCGVNFFFVLSSFIHLSFLASLSSSNPVMNLLVMMLC